MRRQLLGDWADDPPRQRQIERLAGVNTEWSIGEDQDQGQGQQDS